MLFLYIFGNNVNDKMGHIGYLLFYLAGAVIAGISYVLSTAHGGPLIGASGAVWAVTGAYLAVLPGARVTVVYLFVFIGQIELPSWAFVLAEFAWDVLSLGRQTQVAHVAHVAHVGGAMFGFVLSLGLLGAQLLPRDQFDVWGVLKQWNRRRQYRDMVAKGYDPFGYAPATAGGREVALDPRVERAREVRADIAESLANQDLARAAELYVMLRSIDPSQVLARQAQLDVANQLNTQQRYDDAAGAYEAFLANYPKFEQIEQVELMLGLIYARYLQQYDRAKGYLVKAMSRLHGDRELAMARAELLRIEPFTIQTGPAL
jgi:tetratricopeptide (TPR) repeat protein